MKMMAVVAAATVMVLSGGAAFVRAQPPQSPQSQAEAPAVTPAEIQRMFEAVAPVGAQGALELSDERYLPFLAKYKALQDVPRRTVQERTPLLRGVDRLTHPDARHGGE